MPSENSQFVDFSSRLVSLIERSGRPQKALAEHLELTPAAISNYRAGRIPKSEELLRIARYFGVTMEWLLTGENPAQKSMNGANQSQAKRFIDRLEEMASEMKTKSTELREIAGRLEKILS